MENLPAWLWLWLFYSALTATAPLVALKNKLILREKPRQALATRLTPRTTFLEMYHQRTSPDLKKDAVIEYAINQKPSEIINAGELIGL